MTLQTVAIVGLGTMGRNLSLNFRDHDIAVAGYDPSAEMRAQFTQSDAGTVYSSLSQLLSSLPAPRVVILLIPDTIFDQPYLLDILSRMAPGDILIDAGNSHYHKTAKFQRLAAEQGIAMIGMGVSGGEAGARSGAALMLGGDPEAITTVTPLLTPVAATLGSGECCLNAVGPSSSGHFVKMVHNGIEYAEMQLISEIWQLLHHAGGLAPVDVAAVFSEWNRGALSSYLLASAVAVLEANDPVTNGPLIDQIVDRARQKGTGQWAVEAALQYGAPAPSIAEAVFARQLSSHSRLRESFNEFLSESPQQPPTLPIESLLHNSKAAFSSARLSIYAQGFSIIHHASLDECWNIDMAALARGWSNGCIIRGALMEEINQAYLKKPGKENLLLFNTFNQPVQQTIELWQQSIHTAMHHRLPTPVLSSALSYFDSWHSKRLGADLIQGMRDRFGAHGFSRKDMAGEYHFKWE
ncbi:MAG: NADP-dependent phosphogluconate dehydrogenase [Gammaproteobacteria bacterium]|jgi:6-phosphogluconate dehydrogenase|nr:NADP-dependent phosphogluconate dehydrogenase [Gammaproteobacteria bacterium]MBT7308639.1 NADP-dependent phosphogluconate dehydrogenase [Gammaproteobacteria bacterium]